jgi:hypothetical protein
MFMFKNYKEYSREELSYYILGQKKENV